MYTAIIEPDSFWFFCGLKLYVRQRQRLGTLWAVDQKMMVYGIKKEFYRKVG